MNTTLIILALCFALVPATSLAPFMCDTHRCNEGDVDEFCSDEQYPRCMACVDADFLCGTENMPNKCYKYCTEKEVKRRLLREKDKICPLLENTPLVSFNASANSTHGEIVLATCPPGRHLSGANIIQCHFGEWSPLPPTCIVTQSHTGQETTCDPFWFYVAIILGVCLVFTIIVLVLVCLLCKPKKADFPWLPLKKGKESSSPQTPSNNPTPDDETCKLLIESDDSQVTAKTTERRQRAIAVQPRSVDPSYSPETTADRADVHIPTANTAFAPTTTFPIPSAPPRVIDDVREEASNADEQESTTPKQPKPKQPPQTEEPRAGERRDVKPPSTTEAIGSPLQFNLNLSICQDVTQGGTACHVGNIHHSNGEAGASEDIAVPDDKDNKTSNTCRAEDFNSVPTQESSLNDSDFIPKPTSIITAVQPESAQVDPSHTDSAPVDPPPAAQSLHTQPCDRTDKGKFLLRDNIVDPNDINIETRSRRRRCLSN